MADQSFAAGLVGVVLDGRYRLDALLGEGGMGAVFRAHHLAMDRKVAVKLLKPHLVNDEVATQRFLREARSTVKVESPHAVKVLDFGVTPFPDAQRDYYIVLEYLDGRTVQRELDIDGPFAPARVVHIAKQALHALGAAHRSGLIHRDIKPDNILLMRVGDDPDYAKILDFGVAKLMAGSEQSSHSQLALTQVGMVFGTPEFMSPEQACGLPLDGRSDLYALAATMFAMLTGCGMYRASSPIEWLTHHARTPAPHLAEGKPDLARFTELDDVLQRCLAKRREARPATAEEMIQLLASVESTLTRRQSSAPTAGPAKPTLVARKLKSAPSSYFQALPEDTLDPKQEASLAAKARASAETLVPADLRVPVPTTDLRGPAPTTGYYEMTPSTGRGKWLALGALVIAAMIATAIVVATRKGTKGSDVAKPIERSDAAVVAIDAGEPDAAEAPIDAGIEIDAGVPDVGSGSSGRDAGSAARPRNTEAAKRLAAAEEAKRSGKTFRQLIEADAALRADPKSVRAKFLLADALIASGDGEKGCKYLRDLKRMPAAVALAKSAKCSGN